MFLLDHRRSLVTTPFPARMIRGESVEAAIFEAFSVESVRNADVRCRTATPCPSMGF
jgi:hypothetical protein